VSVEPALVTDHQALELVEPGEHALDYPPVPANFSLRSTARGYSFAVQIWAFSSMPYSPSFRTIYLVSFRTDEGHLYSSSGPSTFTTVISLQARATTNTASSLPSASSM